MFVPRKVTGEGRAGALQGTRHRLLSRIEDLGNLGRAEPEHIAQYHHDPLAGRQKLQSGDKGQRDRLTRLETNLGSGFALAPAMRQCVGIWLQPGDLSEPGGLGRLDGQAGALHRACDG